MCVKAVKAFVLYNKRPPSLPATVGWVRLSKPGLSFYVSPAFLHAELIKSRIQKEKKNCPQTIYQSQTSKNKQPQKTTAIDNTGSLIAAKPKIQNFKAILCYFPPLHSTCPATAQDQADGNINARTRL